MPFLYCCMENCWKSEASKHRFPNPKKFRELFDQWIILTGNRRLIEKGVTADKVYTSYRVCSLHFDDNAFGPNRTLKQGVLPTLNLPGNFFLILFFLFIFVLCFSTINMLKNL